MKKKSLLIAGAVLLTLALCLGLMAAKNLSFRVGRCLVTQRGDCLLLMDNAPIQLSDRTPLGTALPRCATGDLVLVLHDGIQETWPGRTGCYLLIRLGRGTAADIPAIVLNELDSMGWTVAR